MQQAFKWLNVHKVKCTFHDYKESGIDKATLEIWLKHFATDKLINTKSATWHGFFNALAFTHKKEHVIAIMDAKKKETRTRRIQKMVMMLQDQMNKPGKLNSK